MRATVKAMQTLNLYQCHIEENISYVFKMESVSFYVIWKSDTNQKCQFYF